MFALPAASCTRCLLFFALLAAPGVGLQRAEKVHGRLELPPTHRHHDGAPAQAPSTSKASLLAAVDGRASEAHVRSQASGEGHRKRYTPMEALGYGQKTAADPALENIVGPAARLGLDVKPRGFHEEAEPVKHYEFESIPTDQRPPLKLRDIEQKVAPFFAVFRGLFLGLLALVPMYLFYVWRNTENGGRNVLIATGVMIAVFLVGFVLHRGGLFEALWQEYGKRLGDHWLEGVLLIPATLVAFLLLGDLIVRGYESLLGGLLAKIPLRKMNNPLRGANSIEGVMAKFM